MWGGEPSSPECWMGLHWSVSPGAVFAEIPTQPARSFAALAAETNYIRLWGRYPFSEYGPEKTPFCSTLAQYHFR